MDNTYTKERRKTHTILLPEMMEYHFDLISAAFRGAGYKMEVLNYKNPDIPKVGLEYCNNDICYPCVLITGQLISALKHKAYDPDSTAFLIPQAGGACRAGNYYYIIKKALVSAGFPQVPVISLNVTGKEKHKGFQLSLRLGFGLIAGAVYGDLLQALYLETREKEEKEGESKALFDSWNQKLSKDIENHKSVKKRDIQKNTLRIIEEFRKIKIKEKNAPRVGIVGEIYIKSCRLGNNNLEDYLVKKYADYFMSGFTSYCLYVADTSVASFLEHHNLKLFSFVNRLLIHWLDGKQKLIYKPLKENGYLFFSYKELKNRDDHVLAFNCSTADGWLVSAEIMALIEAGYRKILITLPFGCMVSHVCSKGITRSILKKYPDALIYPIEYDSSISPVTQENRIMLVLQN